MQRFSAPTGRKGFSVLDKDLPTLSNQFRGDDAPPQSATAGMNMPTPWSTSSISRVGKRAWWEIAHCG